MHLDGATCLIAALRNDIRAAEEGQRTAVGELEAMLSAREAEHRSVREKLEKRTGQFEEAKAMGRALGSLVGLSPSPTATPSCNITLTKM